MILRVCARKSFFEGLGVPLGGLLAASWRPLGASLARLGGLLAHLGASWVRLGASLARPAAFGRLLARKASQHKPV